MAKSLKERMVKLRTSNPLLTVAQLVEITLYGDAQERDGNFLAAAASVLKVPQQEVDEALAFTKELPQIDVPAIVRRTHTHTYVVMELSARAYAEIEEKMLAAGYEHAFGDDGEIDMDGIAVTKEQEDG